MATTNKTKTITGLALFTAIIVVLQMVATFIKFGPFSVTLVMVPIVVGAAIYGVKGGAYLGGAFGVVVAIACVAGWDIGGNMLWNVRPFVTLALCIAKGALAGLAAGGVYKLFAKKNITVATVLAAIAGPLVNTGTFCLAMAFLFHDTLVAWAGGTSVIYYTLTGLVGINFLLELGINIIVSPVIVRIIRAKKSI
ncbi:MAG: ECF transporter S component [Pseudoflavonifractor sp.]